MSGPKASKPIKSGKNSKKEDYKYPSQFGSHASMVDEVETAKLNDPTKVVCEDHFGKYVTELKRLDDGMADTNRNQSHRFERIYEK